jgi:pilus assembly protein FimV
MREYTLLLDPPVYSPGETSGNSAPVAPATTSSASDAGAVARAVQTTPTEPAAATETSPLAAAAATGGTYRVNAGDTLGRIARRLHPGANAVSR